MARRSKQTNELATSRSTASMFKDVDGISVEPLGQSNSAKSKSEEDQTTDLDNSTSNIEDPNPNSNPKPSDSYDDPYSHPFPFNFIYAGQDFLNDNLDTRKSIQLLILLYLLQLFYLSDYDLVWRYLETMAMNYSGVAVGMAFSYNLRLKKSLAGSGDEPKLPEFNLIYAMLIPNLFCLKFDCNLVECLSLNYFVIENIPIITKALSAVAYFMLYGDNSNVNQFLPKLIFFVLLNIAINYINEGNEEHVISKEVETQEIDYDLVEMNDEKIKSGFNTSLSKTEIHLIIVSLVYLIFNLNTNNLHIIIFQKLIISLIIGLVLTYPIFKVNKLISLVIFCGIFYYFTNYQLEPLLNKNSVIWLIELIEQPNNFQLFLTWLGILSINIIIIFNINLEFNLRRKVWHFLILGTILPSVIINRSFTILGLLGSLIILILVEIIRANKITFVGEIIYDKLYRFQDFKDLKGPLNLSYIFLLIGIGFPILIQELVDEGDNMNNNNNSNHQSTFNIKSFIGLVSLGVGDSIASIVGKRFGNIRYFGSNKTIEGSIGFLVTNLVALYYLQDYLELPPMNWEVVFVTNLLACLLEGVTTMNDNLFIPLIIYIIWVILEKVV